MKSPCDRININFTIPEPITEQSCIEWIKNNLFNTKIISENNKIHNPYQKPTGNIEILTPENSTSDEIFPIEIPIKIGIISNFPTIEIFKLINNILPIILDVELITEINISRHTINNLWIRLYN